MLFDLGTHLLDQAVQLFGPATVTHAELAARRAGEKTDDDVFLALRHESGVTTHLWMNMLCAQQGPRFRLLGSDGAFTKHVLTRRSPSSWPAAARWIRTTGSRTGTGPGCRPRRAGLDRMPTERGAYPEFYRILAGEDQRRRGGVGIAAPGRPGRTRGGAAADRAGAGAG